MTSWQLAYRSAAGTTDVILFSWHAQTITAQGYLLIAGAGYSGSPTPDGKYTTGGLAAAGGGLALRDAQGGTVDSVGYGSATNAFVEGSAAPDPPSNPSPGASIARMPNGTDTNNNAADFQIADTPTPKAPN